MFRRRIMMQSLSMPDSGSGIDTSNYLTIIPLEDNFEFTNISHNLEFCIDGSGVWKSVSLLPQLRLGQIVSFRGISSWYFNYFRTSGRFNLYGDCLSIIYGDNAKDYNVVPDNAFDSLFYYSKVVKVDKNFLRATNVSAGAYKRMFDRCEYLTTPPELPAMTIGESCYEGMFRDCTSLIVAPTLPANYVAKDCYKEMFKGCRKLNKIKVFATKSDNLNFIQDDFSYTWLSGVAERGTFTTNKENSFPWKYGVSGIPYNWSTNYE